MRKQVECISQHAFCIELIIKQTQWLVKQNRETSCWWCLVGNQTFYGEWNLL